MASKTRKPITLGVAGGSGSGKTALVNEMVRGLGANIVTVIQHDAYYRDRSHLSAVERARINYDHPDALETELLVAHLRALQEGRDAPIPVYDFASHTRIPEVTLTRPAPVIIVEGILVLVDPRLREALDIKVFVDTDPDIRILRRLARDINERDRSFAAVVEQYQDTVRPMHLEFVEPSRRHADVIIPEGAHNTVGLDMLITKVRSIAGPMPEI